jgi:hypothetical protein
LIVALFQLSSNPKPEGITMTNDNEYNGWANYETWNVALYLDNDEGIYNFMLEGLRHLLAERNDDWTGISTQELRELVQSAFRGDSTPDGVRLSHSEIDWSEISDKLLEMAEGNDLATQPAGDDEIDEELEADLDEDAKLDELDRNSDADFEPDRLDMADGPDDRYHSGTGEMIDDDSYDNYLDNNSGNYWNG